MADYLTIFLYLFQINKLTVLVIILLAVAAQENGNPLRKPDEITNETSSSNAFKTRGIEKFGELADESFSREKRQIGFGFGYGLPYYYGPYYYRREYFIIND